MPDISLTWWTAPSERWPPANPPTLYLDKQASVASYDHHDSLFTMSLGSSFFHCCLTEILFKGIPNLGRISQAEKFIFLEYFIVTEGLMWTEILDILKQKVAQGVDVRLIYDDLGCFFLLPTNYQKTLEAMGIQY